MRLLDLLRRRCEFVKREGDGWLRCTRRADKSGFCSKHKPVDEFRRSLEAWEAREGKANA